MRMQILKTYEDVSDEKNKRCVLVDIKETGRSSVAYFKRYRQKIEGLRFGTDTIPTLLRPSSDAAILDSLTKRS